MTQKFSLQVEKKIQCPLQKFKIEGDQDKNLSLKLSNSS